MAEAIGEVLVFDTETNGFLPELTKLHMIQIGDAETDEVTVYADHPGYAPISDGLARLKAAKTLVGHNASRFDIHAVNKLFPGTIRPEQIWDSLVVARLLYPDHKEHSLKAWGERLKIKKLDYEGGFETFNEDMVVYGRQDIVVGRALYKQLLRRAEGWDWDRAIWIENLFSYVISLQEQNGFPLNVPKAIALAAELRQEQQDIVRELREIFPPIVHERYSEKTGKRLKDKVEVFNPGSGKQIAERLVAKYGWKPKKYTEKGAIATDETVMASLPYPEAKVILRYLGIQKMLGQIEDGKNGWLKLVDTKTSRVHGAVNTLGAATGRCSHFKPNMAQVSKKDLRMREVWEPRAGWKEVGVDAEGLEFRMLAHYMAAKDNGKTIDTVLNGDKSKGTDIHSLNKKAADFYLRDSAKTAISTGSLRG